MQGCIGIRGVWGGVKKDTGVIVAPPHGILTKKDSNLGKYQLPHVLDQILQDTLALQLE